MPPVGGASVLAPVMVAPGMDISMARSTSGCTATWVGGSCAGAACTARGTDRPSDCATACDADVDAGPWLPSGNNADCAFAVAAADDAAALCAADCGVLPVAADDVAGVVGVVGVRSWLMETNCWRLFTSTNCVMYCMGSVCWVGS